MTKALEHPPDDLESRDPDYIRDKLPLFWLRSAQLDSDRAGPKRQPIQSQRGHHGNELITTPTISPTHHETTRNDTQHPETGSPGFFGDFSMILVARDHIPFDTVGSHCHSHTNLSRSSHNAVIDP
jgi:hypothetical protein